MNEVENRTKLTIPSANLLTRKQIDLNLGYIHEGQILGLDIINNKEYSFSDKVKTDDLITYFINIKVNNSLKFNFMIGSIDYFKGIL